MQHVRRPPWLVQFQEKRIPDAAASMIAQEFRTQNPEARFSLLGYGLARSTAMTQATFQSIKDQLTSVLTPAVDVYISAYCNAPDCDAGTAAAVIRHVMGEDLKMLTLTPVFNKSLLARPSPGCKDSASGSQQANQLAAGLSLSQVYQLSVRARSYDAYVVWRLDTLILPPRLTELWFNEPWRYQDSYFAPALQNGGKIEDRFFYTSATTMRKYMEMRLAMLEEPTACFYAEAMLIEFVRRHRELAVTFSHVRHIRLRADLMAPDVDNVTTLLNIRARGWMMNMNELTPLLHCVDWDRKLREMTLHNRWCKLAR